MNMKKAISTAALGLILAVGAMSSSAIPIQLAYGPVNTQPANQGQATVEAWLASVVTSYNSLTSSSLPAPGLEVFRVNTGDAAPVGYPSFGSGLLSLDFPAGDFSYLVLHWGGNPSLNTTYACYLGNDGPGTTLTFNAPGQNGLSSYSVYHPIPRVPDAGATALLLGLGLGALAFSARKGRE